jgi:hypothetical protein
MMQSGKKVKQHAHRHAAGADCGCTVLALGTTFNKMAILKKTCEKKEGGAEDGKRSILCICGKFSTT